MFFIKGEVDALYDPYTVTRYYPPKPYPLDTYNYTDFRADCNPLWEKILYF